MKNNQTNWSFHSAAAAFLFLIVTGFSARAATVEGKPGSWAGKTFTVGILTSRGDNQESQNREIILEALSVFGKREKLIFSPKLFYDKNEYIKTLRDGKLDMAFGPDYDSYIAAMKSGYKPFLSLSMFGREEIRTCIYARNESGFKDIGDLKGKSIMTYLEATAYLYLKKRLGTPPEDYFSKVRTTPHGLSALYALSMKDTDTVFVQDSNFYFMKLMNPGPVKDVKEIWCTDSIPLRPVLHNKDVPEKLAAELVKFMNDIGRDEGFKKYWPLIKQFNVKIKTVKKQDYDPQIKLFDEAEKKGWMKEYKAWAENAKPE